MKIKLYLTSGEYTVVNMRQGLDHIDQAIAGEFEPQHLPVKLDWTPVADGVAISASGLHLGNLKPCYPTADTIQQLKSRFSRTCYRCQGSGEICYPATGPDPEMLLDWETCPVCDGTGKSDEKPAEPVSEGPVF